MEVKIHRVSDYIQKKLREVREVVGSIKEERRGGYWRCENCEDRIVKS
ncbi:4410_t:CDS:2 [Racocetra fulgida]|uniref:4410_t:CDS:1 n=1 Tax=Racocetra fulgida TaxID=60492 RepID=A0A9N9FJ53_9GLOM|nr:4410_t:CDS:2 [Racocetra fulgida]